MRHTSTEGTAAKPACKDAHQKEESEDLPSKRRKIMEDDLDEDNVLAEFDPSSLTESKEGTCKVLQMIAKYLSKHLRRAFKKTKREVMSCEHPCPDSVSQGRQRVCGKSFPQEIQ